MRYTFLLVAFLFACGGGKNSNTPPPASDDQTNNNRDLPDGGTDAGVDGGTDGGTDGGADGGVDLGLSGRTAQLRSAERPCEGGAAADAPGDALICCTAETDINCRVGASPARRIVILEPGQARIIAKIYSDTQCHTLAQTLSAQLPFSYGPDLWDVEVNFNPPLPAGFTLSIKWTTGEGELGCPETACQAYTIGTSPEGCWDYCMH